MKKRPTTSKKHIAVKRRFKYLRALKENGVRKHTSAWCIAKCAEEFYLEITSVENIVYSN